MELDGKVSAKKTNKHLKNSTVKSLPEGRVHLLMDKHG